jgi:hypothetical protein
METLLPSQWVAQCAVKLHERWTTVDQATLEEVAMELWKNREYRVMEPDEAASIWLTPIAAPTSQAQPAG